MIQIILTIMLVLSFVILFYENKDKNVPFMEKLCSISIFLGSFMLLLVSVLWW